MQSLKRPRSPSPETPSRTPAPDSRCPIATESGASSSSSASSATRVTSATAETPPSFAQYDQGTIPAALHTPLRSRKADESLKILRDWDHAQVTSGPGAHRHLKYRCAGINRSAEEFNILTRADGASQRATGLFEYRSGRELVLILGSQQAAALVTTTRTGAALRKFVMSCQRQFEAHTGAPANRTILGLSDGEDFEDDMDDYIEEAIERRPGLRKVISDRPDLTEIACARIWLEQDARSALEGLDVPFMSIPGGSLYIGLDGTLDTFPEGHVTWEQIPTVRAPVSAPAAGRSLDSKAPDAGLAPDFSRLPGGPAPGTAPR